MALDHGDGLLNMLLVFSADGALDISSNIVEAMYFVWYCRVVRYLIDVQRIIQGCRFGAQAFGKAVRLLPVSIEGIA